MKTITSPHPTVIKIAWWTLMLQLLHPQMKIIKLQKSRLIIRQRIYANAATTVKYPNFVHGDVN